MAYSNIYWAGWHSFGGLRGYIYIDKDGYGGGSSQLTVRDESVEIEYGFQDWNDPVIGMTASFSIINDKSDFYELLPLLTSEERLYKVRITVIDPSAYTLFEGFLNCDTVTQRMLHRQEIRFSASSYLSKLENVNPPFIETLENVYFINAISSILAQTGIEQNIRVNCALYSRYATMSNTQTLFNLHTFYTELYWEDNVKRKNSLDVLRSILSVFDCYLYWWNNCWYIERYEDIWTDDSAIEQHYVEYTYGIEYASADDSIILDEGTNVKEQKSISDIQDLLFLDTSQELGVIPGYKNIEVQLNTARYLNMTLGTLRGITEVEWGSPDPPLRTWQCWKDSPALFWTPTAGQPFYDINDSIQGINQGGHIPETERYKGLATKIAITRNSDSEGGTVLNINFKVAWWFGTQWETREDCTITYCWWLRVGPTNLFIVYDEIEKTWTLTGTSEYNGLNYIAINGKDFKGVGIAEWGRYDISIQVPIGEVISLSDGDYTMVFGVGLAEYDHAGDKSYEWNYFGDFVLTVSEPDMDNVITGAANTKFLNKKTLEMDLFDISSLNYKNGIYHDDVRTIDWTTDGVNYYSLVDRLLKNKFQLYNASRQKIAGKVRYVGKYRPLQMFEDTNQSDKPFILMSYVYNLTRDEYTVNLFEYDNTTAINLV